MDTWNTTIANLIKIDVEQMPLTERQKKTRKEFIDATKELFSNPDERKASVHFVKIIEILLSNHQFTQPMTNT